MELEEDSDDKQDDESPVVFVTSTREGAVTTPEVNSHAPRAKDTEHEAHKYASEVYVGKSLANPEPTNSVILPNVSSKELVVVLIN